MNYFRQNKNRNVLSVIYSFLSLKDLFSIAGVSKGQRKNLIHNNCIINQKKKLKVLIQMEKIKDVGKLPENFQLALELCTSIGFANLHILPKNKVKEILELIEKRQKKIFQASFSMDIVEAEPSQSIFYDSKFDMFDEMQYL